MILIATLIALTSIWVLGWVIVTQRDMALDFLLDRALETKLKIFKPIITCHWCMPSIHSIFGYLFALGIGVIEEFSFRLIIIYPLVVAGSSLTVGLIWSVYEMIEAKTAHYAAHEKILKLDYINRVINHKKTKKSNGEPSRNSRSSIQAGVSKS